MQTSKKQTSFGSIIFCTHINYAKQNESKEEEKNSNKYCTTGLLSFHSSPR